jgi:hypothetical protein
VTRRALHGFAFGLALAAALTWRAVPATAQAAPADSIAPDTVRFTFAFPVGLEASVTYTKVIEREEGGPATRIEIEGEYAMHVHPHPSGLLIEHLDPIATRFTATPPLAADDPRRVVYSTLGAPPSDWVVSGDGELLGLAGLEALAGSITQALAPLGLDEGETQAALADLMGEPQLMGSARDLWRAMVEAWVDSEMVVGESLASEAEETNPIIPSVVLPYRYEYTLVGMEPCPAPGGTCAHLRVVSFPDPRELTRVMSDAMRQLGLTTLSFERLVQLTTMTVLADPTTLLPHALEVSKQVEGILLDAGVPRVFRRGDQTQLIFTY